MISSINSGQSSDVLASTSRRSKLCAVISDHPRGCCSPVLARTMGTPRTSASATSRGRLPYPCSRRTKRQARRAWWRCRVIHRHCCCQLSNHDGTPCGTQGYRLEESCPHRPVDGGVFMATRIAGCREWIGADWPKPLALAFSLPAAFSFVDGRDVPVLHAFAANHSRMIAFKSWPTGTPCMRAAARSCRHTSGSMSRTLVCDMYSLYTMRDMYTC